MTTWQLLVSTWDWEPSVLLGCAALAGGYLVLVRFRPARQALYFAAGVLTLLLALISPLDGLGDTYLFSAHMLQHLLLILAVPPLLLLGIPAPLADRALSRRWLRLAEQILGNPFLAWLLGVGVVWLWHLPAMFDATLESESIHILEHISFLVTGVIFWWPIYAPLAKRRLSLAGTLAYLLPAGMASTLLGIILALAPRVIYAPYLDPAGTQATLALIRDGWGLSPIVDQQIAGLLMWVPGSLVYMGVALGAFIHWMGAPEDDEGDWDLQTRDAQGLVSSGEAG